MPLFTKFQMNFCGHITGQFFPHRKEVKNREKYELRPYLKYGFHWTEFYETHNARQNYKEFYTELHPYWSKNAEIIERTLFMTLSNI